MRRSWWFGVVIWLAVVVVASATAWAVIDTAGRQVLADPSPGALVPAGPASSSVSLAPTEVLSPRPSRTGSAGATPGAEQPSSGPAGPPPGPSSTPEDRPSRDAAFTEGTWRGAAGTVTARCTGGAVGLRSATPTDGYQVEVGATGPEELEVKFSGEDGEVKVDARCVGGQPRFDVESDEADDEDG